jgi:hypothetical protein
MGEWSHVIWEYGMKTTVEISDAILEKAKRLARKRGTSLRAIVEEGLRLLLSHQARVPPFRLENRSVQGKGPAPEFADADWSAWRAAAYGDRE